MPKKIEHGGAQGSSTDITTVVASLVRDQRAGTNDHTKRNSALMYTKVAAAPKPKSS